MNKKGDGSSFSLIQLVKIIIVVLIFVAFIAVGYALYKAFFAADDNDALDNFNALADQIDLLTGKSSNYDYTQSILILSNNYIITGYASDKEKPEMCKETKKACLCLSLLKISGAAYVAFKDEQILACKSLGTDIQTQIISVNAKTDETLITDYPPTTPKLLYQTFRIVGLAPVDFGKGALLYIEKYSSPSMTSIFIAPVCDSPGCIKSIDLQKRMRSLEPCPDSSDADCIGKTKNSPLPSGICRFINDRCIAQSLESCSPGSQSVKDCLCGDQVMNKDYSCYKIENGNFAIIEPNACSQNKIKDCEDYCNTDDDEYCSDFEKIRCLVNPCSSTIGKCELVPSTIRVLHTDIFGGDATKREVFSCSKS
jgi:hypothetical protein